MAEAREIVSRALRGGGGLDLFDADDHGVGADEMFDAGFFEAGFFHPSGAVGSGVVEAAGGFDEHVEAHHEAEGVLGAVVVDDAFVDDECSSGGEGVVCLADEQLLLVEVPVVEDVAHHDDVGVGDGASQKLPGWNLTRPERPLAAT